MIWREKERVLAFKSMSNVSHLTFVCVFIS